MLLDVDFEMSGDGKFVEISGSISDVSDLAGSPPIVSDELSVD